MADGEVRAQDLAQETASTLSGNEQFVMFDNTAGKRADIDDVATYVAGDKTTLKTTNKTSPVAAINENFDAIADVKEDIAQDIYTQGGNVLIGVASPVNKTAYGVTYDWSGLSCHVTGQATERDWSNIIVSPSELPFGIETGKKYYLRYANTNNNLKIGILLYRNGSIEHQSYYVTDAVITIPDYITGIIIRLEVANGASYNDTVIVGLSNALSNNELETLINRLEWHSNAWESDIFLKNGYITSTGQLSTNSDWRTLYMVPVYKNDSVQVIGFYRAPSLSGTYNINAYDSEKNFISGVWSTTSETTYNDTFVTLPAGTCYISVTTYKAQFESNSGKLFINNYGYVEKLEKINSNYNAIINNDTNNYYSTASGTIVDYPVEKDALYEVYFRDIKNAASLSNPVIYLFNTSNQYITITDRKYINDALIVTVKTANDSSFMRLYMNKESSASYASCIYSIRHVKDRIIDLIEKNDTIKTLNRTTAKIFKKVVCCGDSYTSGHIQLPGEASASTTNEEYAWPHYMGTASGNQWINCGCSGCNVLTWQVHERGLPKAITSGPSQAYVIGLMINDASDSDRHVPLGTIADIGTDAQTYYGGLSKIIRELNAISNNAKIFVNTCPKDESIYTGYNQAVRDIVNAYASTYPVFLIDLAGEYKDLYTNASLAGDAVNSHYTAIGYEQFAEIYMYILSDYINNHIASFQNVHEIPYN